MRANFRNFKNTSEFSTPDYITIGYETARNFFSVDQCNQTNNIYNLKINFKIKYILEETDSVTRDHIFCREGVYKSYWWGGSILREGGC